MPPGGLLVSMGDVQNRFFAEGLSQQLQSDGKFRRSGKAAGDADAANASEIARNCENIGKVHLQWIIRFLACLEGSRWSRWSDDGIHVLERTQEIPPDESSY